MPILIDHLDMKCVQGHSRVYCGSHNNSGLSKHHEQND